MKNPFSANKAQKIEQLEKAIKDLKTEPAKEETDTTKEIPLGFKIPVEFTKVKKGKKADGTLEEGHRVVTQRIAVKWRGNKTTFIKRGNNLYYLDTESLLWEPASGKKKGHWKLQLDENLCEPLGADGKAHRSWIVSMILRDESMMQLVQIAQQFLPLTITKPMVVTTLVFGSMIFLLGLGINEIFHTAPTTVVHWLNGPAQGIP